MNLCQQMSCSDRGGLGEAWGARPGEGLLWKGPPCSAGHFSFSMWVRKILVFHTPRIPKAKYLLSALPFPSQAEVAAMPGSWGGRGKPLQGGALGITPQLSPKLCSPVPGLLWEITGRFPGDWRKHTGELPEGLRGQESGPMWGGSWWRAEIGGERGRHWASFWDSQPPGQQDPET